MEADRLRRPVRYANQLPDPIEQLGNGQLLPLDGDRSGLPQAPSPRALQSTKEGPVLEAFRRLFQEHGLPSAIRSGNGLPFASPNGLYNLSRLPVFWLRLRIVIERIKPGHPQQHARHERMHLTLKKEAIRPACQNSLARQVRFDDFMSEFYTERPHEALAVKTPPSLRPFHGLPDIEYPLNDKDVLVTACGRICMNRKKINISTVMAGQRLGNKEVDKGIWLVSFMHYDLGYMDLEQRTLQTIDNPFGTRLSPMS
ncbi:MAG: integrase core domain-containing protein [Rhodomicrobium sp.]